MHLLNKEQEDEHFASLSAGCASQQMLNSSTGLTTCLLIHLSEKKLASEFRRGSMSKIISKNPIS